MIQNKSKKSRLPRRRLILVLILVTAAVGFVPAMSLFWEPSSERLLNQAQAILLKDPRGAERMLKRVIERENENRSDAQILLGQIVARRGAWDEARQYYSAVQKENCRTDLLLNFGEVALESREFDLAQDALTEVSRREDEESRSQALKLLFSVYMSRDQYHEELECAEALTRLIPDDPKWWMQLARLHEEREQFNDAVEVYQRGLQQALPQRNLVEMRNRLIEHLIYVRGDPGAVRQELDKFEQSQPDQVQLLVHWTRLYHLEGKPQKALNTLNQVMPVLGSHSEALRLRGILYLELEQFQKATADFSKVVQLSPDDEIAHFKLAEVYRRLKKTELAHDHFEAYQKIHKSKLESVTLGARNE